MLPDYQCKMREVQRIHTFTPLLELIYINRKIYENLKEYYW